MYHRGGPPGYQQHLGFPPRCQYRQSEQRAASALLTRHVALPQKYTEHTPDWYTKEIGDVEYLNEFLIDLSLEDLTVLVENKEKK